MHGIPHKLVPEHSQQGTPVRHFALGRVSAYDPNFQVIAFHAFLELTRAAELVCIRSANAHLVLSCVVSSVPDPRYSTAPFFNPTSVLEIRLNLIVF